MKRSTLAVAVLALAAAPAVWGTAKSEPAAPTESPRPAKDVSLAGALWHGSFERAKQTAAKENKPILHFQMFGALDDAMC